MITTSRLNEALGEMRVAISTQSQAYQAAATTLKNSKHEIRQI